MADSLQWAGLSFFLVFLAQVITALFPIALLQPAWMIRVSDSLRGAASLPLIGLIMLMLAQMIDRNVSPSRRYLNFFRQLASFAAIGYFFLIPFQTYGAVAGMRSQLQQGQEQLRSLLTAASLVQKASNEQQLRSAIRVIPGAEQLANRPLGADVPRIKNGLLERLRESVNRLETQLDDSRNKVLETMILPLARDAMISLGYAIGFAGMSYSKSGKPSLLRILFKPRNPHSFEYDVNDDLTVLGIHEQSLESAEANE